MRPDVDTGVDAAWSSLSDVSKDRARPLVAAPDTSTDVPTADLSGRRGRLLVPLPPVGLSAGIDSNLPPPLPRPTFAAAKPLPNITSRAPAEESSRGPALAAAAPLRPQSACKAPHAPPGVPQFRPGRKHQYPKLTPAPAKGILVTPREVCLWNEMDGVLQGRVRRVQKCVRFDLDNISYQEHVLI